MCGIFGFTSKQLSIDTKNILKQMGRTLRHRGPDQSGSYINDNFAMGIERLSILDAKNGNQPIFSNNGNFVIMHNGEVYNYKEIRNDLQKIGYHFNTNTDTEVIVNLYQQKGIAFLNDLNGMFVFAIYDILNKSLIIARDRFGIKPLYYTLKNDLFIFGSELKAILKYPNLDINLSIDALDLYLTFDYVPAPWSIYNNIYKLEQGHYLNLKNNNLEKKKWYQISYQPKIRSLKINDYLDELDFLILESVKRRTISDMPLGAFLSGGLDSSLICYYLSQISKDRIKTFSIGFDEPSFDESTYAGEMASYLGTEHHSQIFTSANMIDIIPRIINSMDEPFADASFLPTYLLSSITSDNVTVALSGDGGDEVFAGYPTYFARKLVKWIPRWLYPIMKYSVNKLPVNDDNISFDFKSKKFTFGLGYNSDIRHQYWLGSFTDSQKNTLYNKDIRYELNKKNLVEDLINNHMKNCDTENNWERSLWSDMRFYLQDDMLVKVDRASMLNSLEVRIPFLDHILVEFALRIPSALKYKRKNSKYILKKLGKRYLPKNIVNRDKKGFGIPIAKWIKKDLKDDFIETLSAHQNLFNKGYIDSLFSSHINNKMDNRKLLWSLFIFLKWNQR